MDRLSNVEHHVGYGNKRKRKRDARGNPVRVKRRVNGVNGGERGGEIGVHGVRATYLILLCLQDKCESFFVGGRDNTNGFLVDQTTVTD